jgi:CHAD domain-containing protein
VREREIKLETPENELDETELDATVAAVDGLRIERVDVRVLTAHYYDTDDVRLARWGCSVRHRDDEGLTVKLPVGRSGSEVTRDEVHIDSDLPGGAERPPDDALRLVEPFLRGERVNHVATLVTHRRALVLSANGVTLGELTDDRVRIDRPGRSIANDDGPTAFHELELEFAGAGSDNVDDVASDLVDALESIGCVPAASSSKVARALGPRAGDPPDVVVPPLDDQPAAAAVVRHALSTSVQQLLLQLPVVRIGDDPEGVHQARVALRRLRSDLKTFRPLLDRAWANDLRSRAKWLADRLGDVRDDDVHLEMLDHAGASGAVVDVIREERTGHRSALLEALDEPQTRALLQALVAAANDPVLTVSADEDAAEVLTPLVRKRWRRLRKAVRSLPDTPATTELHAVRILAKRCRYAAMASAPAIPDAVVFAKRLGKLQDALGAIHDNDLLAERLAELARGLDPHEAFAAGEVAGRLRADAAAARAEWPRRWRAAKKASPF